METEAKTVERNIGRRLLIAFSDATPGFTPTATHSRGGVWRRLLIAFSDAAPAFQLPPSGKSFNAAAQIRSMTTIGATRTTSEKGDDFDIFFTQTFSRTLAKAILLCQKRQDAEDATQEAYRIASNAWDYISEDDSMEDFLHSALQRQLLMRARKRDRQQPEEAEVLTAPRDSTPEQTADAKTVLEALAGLTPTGRMIAVLYYLYEQPRWKIAKQLGLLPSTVAINIHSAHRALKGIIKFQLAPKHRQQTAAAAAIQGTTATPKMASPGSPIASTLLATERWLRNGVEDSPSIRTRVREGIAPKTSEAMRKDTGY